MNCPYCDASEAIKKGYRILADGSQKQRWQCSECGRQFSQKETETPAPKGNSSSYEEKEGFVNITCSSPRKMSVEDVLDEFGVDEDMWEVVSFEIKSSEGYRKDREVQWEVEDGVVVSGHVNDTGKMLVVPLYHIKVKLKRREDENRVRVAIKDLLDDAKKYTIKYRKITYPKLKESLLYEVAFPDLHFGRLTWHEESGKDYDVSIARQYLHTAVGKLLAHAEHYPIGRILIPLGNDYFNVNSKTNATAKGTPQQEDTRWQKTFRLGRQLAVEIIDLCSEIAPVDVVLIPGNHDEERLFYMGDALECWYNNNPNVSVDNRAVHRKYYQFGQNLIGFAHGADEKLTQLPMMMAYDVPDMWATSKFREWHTGDKHRLNKLDVAETGGVVVRILRSLVEFDAWTFNAGYMGIKAAEGFLWHPDNGLLAHYQATPD